MTWLHALVIGLAIFRLTRLVAWDEITQPVRARISGIHDANYATVAKFIEDVQARGGDPWGHRDSTPPMSKRRWYWAKLLHCPWCVGWWLSLAVCALAYEWPHAVLVCSWPFAASALVGLVAKNLDP